MKPKAVSIDNMKKKSKIFCQDIPPYRHDIVVSVGATPEEFKRWVKKSIKPKFHKDYLEVADDYKHLFENLLSNKHLGYAISSPENQNIVLLLKKYEDTWVYWETIIHELSHILDWVVDWKNLKGETEARAYLHEYLFCQIRRKIQGTDKV